MAGSAAAERAETPTEQRVACSAAALNVRVSRDSRVAHFAAHATSLTLAHFAVVLGVRGITKAFAIFIQLVFADSTKAGLCTRLNHHRIGTI